MNNSDNSLSGRTQPIPMGIGKLGDKSLVIAREFRWTLKGKILDENFIKKVKFDFKEQKIEFEAYEILANEDINIHTWLESDLSKEELTFKTYDGCGNLIYCYIFAELDIISDVSSFDYSSSAESTRKISLKYKTINRNQKTKTKKYTWSIKVIDGEKGPVNIALGIRPTLKIEETRLNYLNASILIPGKCEWQKIRFELNKSSKFVLSDLISENDYTVELTLRDHKENVLEKWSLKNANIFQVEAEGEENIHVTLKYNEVGYEAPKKPEISTVI
jgi:hypothetical protein